MLEIEPKNSSYEDLPLTKFPVSEDTWRRMTDVNLTLLPLITKFNDYLRAGNLAAANKLIADNPELSDCLFNAEKINQIMDAIKALERYFLEEIQEFYIAVAQNAIGINDNPSKEQDHVVAYSARHIDQLIGTIQTRLDMITNTAIIALQASNWSNSAPYSQRVAVPGLKATDNPTVSPWTPKTLTPAATKLQQKMAAFITSGTTENGYITLYCGYRKPTADFKVILEGVSV